MKYFILPLISWCLLNSLSACNNSNANTSKNEALESKGETENEVILTAPTSNENLAGDATGVKVKMVTNFGDITLLLYDETPVHRDNFVKLVKEKFYEGLLFHRIIKDFMIQGGDPNSKGAAPEAQLGNGGPGYTLKAEINPEQFIHKKGALSAARQGDQVNPMKESSGSQFYIVTGKITSKTELEQMCTQLNAQKENACITEFMQKPENAEYMEKIQKCQELYQADNSKMQEVQESINKIVEEIKPEALKGFSPFDYSEEQIATYETIGGTPFLDGGYTVFGEVLEGLEIVEKMGVVETLPGDRPKEDVKIISMEIIQ